MRRKVILSGVVLLTAIAIFTVFAPWENQNENADNHKTDNRKTEAAFIDILGEKEASWEKNIQGNIENGGQVTGYCNGMLLSSIAGGLEEKTIFFDLDTRQLSVACAKEGCLHNDSLCIGNHCLCYLLSYGPDYYGASRYNRNEIWKCQDAGKLSLFYKSNDDIYGLWGYQEYLYYMTDLGVFRIDIESGTKKEKVLDTPVLFEYLTFSDSKMYFCDEDRILYRANPDGSHKEKISEDKALAPQVLDGKVYYRCANYDKDGKYEMENTLCSIDTNGENKIVLLEEVYQYVLTSHGIYYASIPANDDGKSWLCFYDFSKESITQIVKCEPGFLYIMEDSDCIIYEKQEGELEEGTVAGVPTHLYCIKKDGTGEERLEYPQFVEGE